MARDHTYHGCRGNSYRLAEVFSRPSTRAGKSAGSNGNTKTSYACERSTQSHCLNRSQTHSADACFPRPFTSTRIPALLPTNACRRRRECQRMPRHAAHSDGCLELSWLKLPSHYVHHSVHRKGHFCELVCKRAISKQLPGDDLDQNLQ